MAIEHIPHTEALPQDHNRNSLHIGATAAFAAVPLDVAVSDRSFYFAQSTFSDIAQSHNLSHTSEWLFTNGATTLTIGAQAVGLAYLVTRSDVARDALQNFEAYAEARQETMGPARKVVSKVVNSPITFLSYVGGKFERAGQKFEEQDNVAVRQIGKTLVDIGQTNSMSTTGVVMYEMGNDEKPVTPRRIGRIAATFAGSWIGVTEGIRHSYRFLGNHFGVAGETAHEAMGASGRFLSEITSVYPLGPGAAFWGGVATACLVAGHNAVKYTEEQKALLPSIEVAQITEQPTV